MYTSGAGRCLARWGDCQEAEDARFIVPVAILGWIVIIVPGLIVILVTGFGCFHLSLIIRGRTTREVVTGRITGEGSTFFAKRGASLLPVKELIQLPPEVEAEFA